MFITDNMLIIWITWTLGAGKWTIVEYLVKKKLFQYFSVRSFLIQEIEKRGLPVNRDSMVMVANDLRAKYGASYIIEQLYQQAESIWKDAIIESIRTLGEAQSLQNKWNFHLFAIDADPKIRYERIVLRASETDKISYEEFLMNEKIEMENPDPAKQNIAKCMGLAQYILINSWTFDQLYEQIETEIHKF